MCEEMRKNVTLIFKGLEQQHLGKDVFLVPYYLGKQHNYNVTIVYPKSHTNKEFPSELRGVKLVPIELRGKATSLSIYRKWNFLLYLMKNARKTDVLVRFHYTIETALMVVIYKLLNSSGITYIKGDINADKIDSSEKLTLRAKIKDYLYFFVSKKIDVFSCETTLVYNKICNSSLGKWQFGEKLVLVSNGFDEDYLKVLNIKEKLFKEKEELIITVGRIGTYEKNNELFLKALEDVNLNGWKVYFIGPIEKQFESIVQSFFYNYPEKRDSVVFLGSISDKKELWEYYNRAKVFVLTSRFEGYPIVFSEAKRFRNYILSTDLPASVDLVEGNVYGEIIPQDDASSLALRLQCIIDGGKDIDVYHGYNMAELSWEKVLDKVKI